MADPQLGAQCFTGAASVLAILREASPIVCALLIAGAGGSAICADLGSRKIRDEIDAMEVLGISPVQRLVVPRVLACMLVSTLLNGLVSVVGVAGGYFFNVILQGGTPGAYLASFSALAQLPTSDRRDQGPDLRPHRRHGGELQGPERRGGPKGVGDAVNQSVVITFLLLFFVNFVITAVYFQLVPPKGVSEHGPLRASASGGTACAAAARLSTNRCRSSTTSASQMAFYVKAIAWTPRTLRRYKKEVLRLLAEVTFGTGALAVIGGTVGVITFLSFFTGTEVGLQGYQALNQLGTGAFTGFLSAYFNTREIAPLVAGLALSATVGCGFTAQLGAMRISEEIDALEVMAVPSLPFLVTTRIIAGFVAVIPLYVIGLLSSYFATRFVATVPLRAVDRYLRPLLPAVPAAAGRALVVREGAGLRRGHHADALLLRLHREGRPRGRGRRGRPGRPHLDRHRQRARPVPVARHLGCDHQRPDRGVAAWRRNRGCKRYGSGPRRGVPDRAGRAAVAVGRLLREGVHPGHHGHAGDRQHR